MSWWANYSPELLQQTQTKLIEKSGVTLVPRHVRISETLQLFTLRTEGAGKPLLVLLHGYCASGIVFFKTLPRLAELFSVVLVDLLGMGQSSRPEFRCRTAAESEAFFVHSLELFRAAEGFAQFALAGHSFGGYIAGCYALQHAERVSKLVLLSPVGISAVPAGYNYISSLDALDWRVRWITKFVVFFWVRRDVTPSGLLRKSGPMARALMNFYSKHRIPSLTQEENALIAEYLQQINLLPESGESAMKLLFQPGAWAYHPLCERMKDLTVPVGFLFGDKDWANCDGAQELRSANKDRVLLRTVPKSGHHLYFDNPQHLAEDMISLLHELDAN